MRYEKESIEVGSSIQLQFQRSQLPLESIFKEFIDNSLQSFLTPENREKLSSKGITKCTIKIKIDQDKITISDNAFGMDHEAFRRALKLNEKAAKYAEGSLSEFGMGLKYAAISLGNEYSIESTALGNSEKYKATITSELLKHNSKSVDNEIEEDYPKDSHFTILTIRDLIRKITSFNLNKLMIDLSRIYHKYLENEELEILFLPNRPVKYSPPELWINEDGSEYQEDFQGEIEYEGKKYVYYGWIGILKIADTSKNGVAGFSLFKHRRIVISNYRPEKLFGKANSFPYQRIIGEINLNDWPVDFNKSSFTWNDGLQEEFIESLVDNHVVKKMIKIAKELRKNQPSRPTKEKQQKSAEILQKRFTPLAAKKRTVIEEPTKDSTKSPAYVDLVEDTQPLHVEYEGIEYTFQIAYSEEQDATKKWLVIESIPESKNEYLVKINNNFDIFKKMKNADSDLMQTFVIVVALSQLSSITSGYKDSYKFVNKMNEIIAMLKG
jgi:hypothetical protein